MMQVCMYCLWTETAKSCFSKMVTTVSEAAEKTINIQESTVSARNLTTSLSSTLSPAVGKTPSAHAVLNAPIYASSHDVHVRPFTISTFTTCSKKRKNCYLRFAFICVASIGLPAQKKIAPWDLTKPIFAKRCPRSDRGWHFQKSFLAEILVVRTN